MTEEKQLRIFHESLGTVSHFVLVSYKHIQYVLDKHSSKISMDHDRKLLTYQVTMTTAISEQLQVHPKPGLFWRMYLNFHPWLKMSRVIS